MANTDHNTGLGSGGTSMAEQLARIKTLPPSILAQPTPYSYLFENQNAGPKSSAARSSSAVQQFQPSVMFTDPAAKLAQTNSFFFHYNPSSLGISTQWDTSIANPGSSTKQEGPVVDPLQGLPNVPENFSFELILNRMVEASLSYTGPQAALFQTYGTICDLSLLFRTVNGLQDSDIDAMVAAGLSVTVPATDRGWLAGTMVIVALGIGNITFSGWVTGLDIQHAKFINSMTPVLTTVGISMQRDLVAGTAADPNRQAPKTDKTTGKTAGGQGATAKGSQAGTNQGTAGANSANPRSGGPFIPPGLPAGAGGRTS